MGRKCAHNDRTLRKSTQLIPAHQHPLAIFVVMNESRKINVFRLSSFLPFTLLFISIHSFGQRFVQLDSTTHFDRYKIAEWNDRYESVVNEDSSKFIAPYLSVRGNKAVRIGFLWKEIPLNKRGKLQFFINGDRILLTEGSLKSDTAILEIPAMKNDYSLVAQTADGEIIEKVNAEVYWYQSVEVIIVPLEKTNLNRKVLNDYLNTIFAQAQLKLNVQLETPFKHEDIDPKKLFGNPIAGRDRYTDQMHEMRDAYFEQNDKANKSAYYVFLVPGFVNEELNGYNVPNKTVSFVKLDAANLSRVIAQQLGSSIGALRATWLNDGPTKGSTKNLMDDGTGTFLTQNQWESIQRNWHAFSMFDDYEDVRTNGGLIAYYFWEENAKGEIVSEDGNLFSQIKTPFKRNQYSYHQNITNVLFKTLFVLFNYRINTIHFIVVILLSIGMYFVRRPISRRIQERARWIKFGYKLLVFSVYIYLLFQTFFLVNRAYHLFEMKSGEITEMHNASMSEMKSAIENGIKPDVLAEDHLGSEIFVNKKDKWILKRRKNVVYFNQYTRNNKVYYTFVKDSDSLIISTHNYAQKAESHYIVINYLKPNGKIDNQRVFNHLHVEITPKLTLKDPTKRILLFVNGYRPTATGNSFEATFDSIQKKGLEYANSNNLIYDLDRYNYWEPWNEMNKRFQSRINPQETFYADGHFSVSTSNHRSLVEFTNLSQNYPNRCKNPKRHVCQDVEGELTFKMFNLTSNVNGFNERRKNGRVAGRNLYQMFNEIPNKSKDDTLFIVAHSMGYAYALGIIDELRGKINFGGFYIIAPENAEAGKVNMPEWNQIWQYGSDFDGNKFKAPCVLDGIAPQTKVLGLRSANQLFIPDQIYTKKGFFDSHFIGYYTWIFDIPKDSPGYIRQR